MGGERKRNVAPATATAWRRNAKRATNARGMAGTTPVDEVPLGFAPAIDADTVLGYQQTAGNQAVGLAMQRAAGPLDDTIPGMALADTVAGPDQATQPVSVAGPTGPAPAPTGGATALSVAGPARPEGPGAVSQPAGPDGVVPVGGGGPVALGGPVTQEEPFGAVDQTAKRTPLKRAAPIPEFAVEAIYAVDPAKVFRSPNAEWHYQLWNLQKGPGHAEEPPVAFKAGDLIAVAPDYTGRATALPDWSGDDTTGLGTPGPAQTGAPTTGSPGTGPATASPERPFTRAIAPGFQPGPEPAGRQTAVAANHDEVVAALAANPASVVRSPNPDWHAQGFQLDKGTGTAPTAYRVGNVIIVAPDYPTEGLPATPGTASVSAAPGTATSVAPSGATSTASGSGAGPTAAPVTGPVPDPTRALATVTPTGPITERNVRTDVTSTKDAPGVAGEVMIEDVTTDGAATTTTGKGGSLTVGGGNVVAVGGQQVTTVATGDTSTKATTGGSATLKSDGTLAVGGERTNETFSGTDAHGQPIRTGATSTFGGVDINDKGVALTGGASQTNAAGTKQTVSGGMSVDANGNVSGQLGTGIQTKGGGSMTASVSGGISVQANDPVPAAGGGFDVTYTVTDSQGAAFGAGQQFGGGPSVGLQLGSSSASLQTGTRHFADADQAKAFRDRAAFLIEREHVSHAAPTTIQGALEIPIGEERGSGDMSGSSIGASASMEGASITYGRSSSETHRFSVKRVSATVVQVTGFVSGTKGSDWSISGGLSNTKGSSATKGFEAVWEFDLGQGAGRDAFERYAQSGLPPLVGATLKSITSSGSAEDHDNVSIPLLGTARWTGTAWEVIKTDEQGTHEQFGGQQARDQDPSWTGRHIFGQDSIHSSAQIVANVEGDPGGTQRTKYQAQVKVSGDSGETNREELGKIFTGVRHDGTAKASGEWTLSAEVSPAVVHELEQVHKEMRDAITWEDKMRVYAQLVKEHGAAMVGAQVGLGGDGTAWNVELKGDRNFPGEAGRVALDKQRAELRARLQADPAGARNVFDESQRTLNELHARRDAVADRTRYTDLPDGLRDEQLKVIDKHIADFELVSHFAAQEAIKANPGEDVGAVEARGARKDGYTDAQHTAEGADMARLRDQITVKEAGIKAIDPRILEAITAVMDAESHVRILPPGARDFRVEHRTAYQEHWDIASTLNDRQSAMAPKADALRAKLLEYLAPAERKSTAEALLALLTDRLALLDSMLVQVISAAEALKPITTDSAMARHEAFWAGVTGDPLPGAEDD